MVGLRPAAACVSLACAVILSGCAHGAGHAPRPPQPTSTVVDDPALDAARTAFDTSRAAMLVAVSQVAAGAAALDKQDSYADKGAFDPARRDQPAAATKAAAAASAAGRLSSLLNSYSAAISALRAIRSPVLTSAQSAALTGLTAAAAREVAAVKPLATGALWTGYRQLQAAQGLWITRAGAGYYPGTNNDLYDAERAGGAYVVLVNPFRMTLDAERATLAAATKALTLARASTSVALDAARAAFG